MGGDVRQRLAVVGVVLPNLIPPEVSCITLFFLSFLPSFAALSLFRFYYEGDDYKMFSGRNIISIVLPGSISRSLALTAGIPFSNVLLLSFLALGVTYCMTQVLYTVVDFVRDRLPQAERA